MTKEQKIHKLFDAIASGNVEKTLSFFAAGAHIHSPVYHSINVKVFYAELFAELKKLEGKIFHFFHCRENPSLLAVHLLFTVTLKNGEKIENEGVDLFEYEQGTDKIRSLKIFYDPTTMRKKLQKTE